MPLPHPTELLHLILKGIIQPGDLAIDATAGNGHDTAFLTEAVGPNGRVIAVDIQEKAIQSTKQRLENLNLLNRVETHQISHTHLDELASEDSVSTIVFNLGYLPGADRTLITEQENTLQALSLSIHLLKLGGILAVICYPGHDGGDRESEAVETFLKKQTHLRVAKYVVFSTITVSPFLLLSVKTTGPK